MPPTSTTDAASGLSQEDRQRLVDGLLAKQARLPFFYFYDNEGSRLYEEITKLDEYYPTRTEEAILKSQARSIVARTPQLSHIIELGSGSSAKTRHLVREALRVRPKVAFHPIDISPIAVEWAEAGLRKQFPTLTVKGYVGSYHDVLPIQDGTRPGDGTRLFLFLGSSIGNFSHDDAVSFLSFISSCLDDADRFLVGTDLVKDPSVLEAAYNDSKGVTAAFNRNLLKRLNREFSANFDPSSWNHVGEYDLAKQRVDLYLEAATPQHVSIPGLGIRRDFAKGERIHTESSQKYTETTFGQLCRRAHLAVDRRWSDPGDLFAVNLLKPDRA